MTAPTPRILIAIPVFNEEKSVDRVLGEVARHAAGFGGEILVIDDGSTDTTPSLLARHPVAPPDVKSYDDVPLETLLPAFLVSELETAFAMGVRLLLPFLVLDLLVAAMLAATGLATVAPSTVALPLKLVVFVMADGWSIVVQSLLDSLHAVG